MDEGLFTKGFNDGYMIEDHKPSLTQTLTKGIPSQNDNSYIEGLKEGQKQRQNELERERIRKSIDRGNSQEKNNDRRR